MRVCAPGRSCDGLEELGMRVDVVQSQDMKYSFDTVPHACKTHRSIENRLATFKCSIC